MSQTEIRNAQNTAAIAGSNLLGPEIYNDNSLLAKPLSQLKGGQEVPPEFKNARPSHRNTKGN